MKLARAAFAVMVKLSAQLRDITEDIMEELSLHFDEEVKDQKMVEARQKEIETLCLENPKFALIQRVWSWASKMRPMI